MTSAENITPPNSCLPLIKQSLVYACPGINLAAGLVKTCECPLRTAQHWLDGTRRPPIEVTRYFRKRLVAFDPLKSEMVSVPGDPDYREIRAREIEAAKEPQTYEDYQNLLLKKNDFTKKSLAAHLNVDLNLLSRILAGRDPFAGGNFTGADFPPDLGVMKRIAQSCQVPIDEFPWLNMGQVRWAGQVAKLIKEYAARGIDLNTSAGVDQLIVDAKSDIDRAKALGVTQ